MSLCSDSEPGTLFYHTGAMTTVLNRYFIKIRHLEAWKTWKNLLTLPQRAEFSPIFALIPLTFKAFTGHKWQNQPKLPPDLRRRTSWEQLHKMPRWLDCSKRPKLSIYYTPIHREGLHITKNAYFCPLVPPTFKPPRAKLRTLTTTRPPTLRSRCSWDPLHKTVRRLSDPERSYSRFTTPLSMQKWIQFNWQPWTK